MTKLEKRLHTALANLEAAHRQVVTEIEQRQRVSNHFRSELAVKELEKAMAALRKADLQLFPGRSVYAGLHDSSKLNDVH